MRDKKRLASMQKIKMSNENLREDWYKHGRGKDYRVLSGFSVIADKLDVEEKLDLAICLENATIKEMQEFIEFLKEKENQP